jgi:hypothetical protein
MFAYSDPTSSGLLVSTGAVSIYRQLVDSAYQLGASAPSTDFITLDQLQSATGAVADAVVEWPSFPLSNSGVPDSVIDSSRDLRQDEYVEWKLDRDTAGRVTRITFTTLFPEYFQALAAAGEQALRDGVRDMIAGANPSTFELFGTSDVNDLDTPRKRLVAVRSFWSASPWNDGTKGILSLVHPANTLGALTNLVGNCAIPQLSVPVGSVCRGSFCGPSRNSDPQVCSATQLAVRSQKSITLADPIGIQLTRLGGGWELDGNLVSDINADPNLWVVSHGGHRGVLTVPTGLRLNGDPIDSGTQVSRVLFVGARVQTVASATLPFAPINPLMQNRRI